MGRPRKLERLSDAARRCAPGRASARDTVAGHLLARFAADRSGATAIEYAMIASGVSVIIAGTVFSIGGRVDEMIGDVEPNLGG
ncbi:MAG: Flp family type IVb pilin [Alphaproteobacteria bacterium]|nr:Flp family type IVb pilin [Alphaproteobacteria bacterium]